MNTPSKKSTANSNFGRISYPFQDIGAQHKKVTSFPHPTLA